MARQQSWVSGSEIELLRRRLGEIASTTGVPDNILQKFERFLTAANDASRQNEAALLASELLQFCYDAQPRTRRISDRAVKVTCLLEPPLIAALDKFIAEQEAVKSRHEAVVIVLKDALRDYFE